jgi:hypothetical protein
MGRRLKRRSLFGEVWTTPCPSSGREFLENRGFRRERIQGETWIPMILLKNSLPVGGWREAPGGSTTLEGKRNFLRNSLIVQTSHDLSLLLIYK